MSDASARGRSNRSKGQRGERELAKSLGELLGIELKRRVRNHIGESDITGLDGYSVEVKHQAVPAIRSWWKQTVDQAEQTGEIPVLFYRLPRKEFRAVMSLSPFIQDAEFEDVADYEQTIDMSLQAFASVYRFIQLRRGEYEIAMRNEYGIAVN